MAEMENLSYVPLEQPIMFTLEGFIITRQQGYPLFVVTLVVFTMMLLGNFTVIVVIVVDVKLHKPMYVMMCNLAACDLLGGTTVMTPLMSQFASGNNDMPYVAAILQAFCVHTYGLGISIILAVMAYDRYVAICQPLLYHMIMTTRRLILLCLLIWSITVSLVATLLALTMRTPLCGTLIMHVYCSNSSILTLACIATPIINIYEMCTLWSVRAGCIFVITFSYLKILLVCVVNREKSRRSKAVQTCITHLTIYILFELSILIIVITYRIQEVSPNAKKFCAIISFIMPPTVNPIIYGIATKDIRTQIVKFYRFPTASPPKKSAPTS